MYFCARKTTKNDEHSLKFVDIYNKSVTFTLTPADATSDLSYSSSDESVFTVEPDATNKNVCTIEGVEAGTANLTCLADNGIYKTVEVTVTASE